MTNVSVKGTINASADDVWKTVSSFRDIEKYLPLVKSSVTEGFGFGARIAFVDYDGKSTYDDYKNSKPKTPSDEIEFVKRNAPMMVKSTESLKEWVKFIKSN
ncbi:MAG: hypothetical protein IIA82_09965 [Thaumarchaeota archaeon]|nr:hypothetical protein [Nitrososphaerota archaeon]